MFVGVLRFLIRISTLESKQNSYPELCRSGTLISILYLDPLYLTVM